MAQKDYYEILGVAESATADEIKRVYRKLAKQYHPDRNKDNPEAEARFKDISAAYDTLKDAKKRAEYDQLRRLGAFSGSGAQPGAGFGGFGGQGFDFSEVFRGGPGGFRRTYRYGGEDFDNVEDILSQLFGGMGGAGSMRGGARAGGRAQSGFEEVFGGRPRQYRGPDIAADLKISFGEMVTGVTRKIRYNVGGKRRTLNVKIPAGIDDGGKVRLSGQGQPGVNGGPNGDLIITVKVMTDQQFRRDGNDVYTSAEVSFIEAIKGTKKNVKTLTKTVAVNIPPGTQPGAKLRLKGQGLAVGDQHGDLFVEVQVHLPKYSDLTEQQKVLLEKWEG